MNNLSQYEQPQENINSNSNKDDAAAAAGYASADDAVHNSRASRERKRGVPWTEEEHKLFLLGLQKVGKGDWRGISRNFVKTRTPTQVASHAQKYFLRRSNLNRRRRRSSLFDITTDSVTAIPMEEEQESNKTRSHPLPPPPLPETNKGGVSGFSVIPAFPVVLPVPVENPIDSLTLGQPNQSNDAPANLIRPIPVLPAPQPSAVVSDLNLNLNMVDPSSLSLKLSLPSDQREASSRHSAFQAMPSLSSNGDSGSIISVA
uniref:Transcription factor R1MYB1 n=1 Tax=Litchi chinensis TaxID=151069 RepID=A0A4D6QS80_LITCN|nr:transcription factor R1MYB1 [Litchi chinensis]